MRSRLRLTEHSDVNDCFVTTSLKGTSCLLKNETSAVELNFGSNRVSEFAVEVEVDDVEVEVEVEAQVDVEVGVEVDVELGCDFGRFRAWASRAKVMSS